MIPQSSGEEVQITITSESQSVIRELSNVETAGSNLTIDNARRIPGLIDEINFAVDFCGPIIGNVTCGILANWIWAAMTNTRSKNEPVRRLHLSVLHPDRHVELTVDAADKDTIELMIARALGDDRPA